MRFCCGCVFVLRCSRAVVIVSWGGRAVISLCGYVLVCLDDCVCGYLMLWFCRCVVLWICCYGAVRYVYVWPRR